MSDCTTAMSLEAPYADEDAVKDDAPLQRVGHQGGLHRLHLYAAGVFDITKLTHRSCVYRSLCQHPWGTESLSPFLALTSAMKSRGDCATKWKAPACGCMLAVCHP